MKTSTGIAMESHLMDLLRRMADEDRRTMSDTVAILVEQEATKRGWLAAPDEPKKKRHGGALSEVK
jgi:hypothetical protein